MEKKHKRQLSWCRRYYPIGSLIEYKLYDNKIKYAIVVDYFYENLGMNLYLKVIDSNGYKNINPGNAKRLQKLYSNF